MIGRKLTDVETWEIVPPAASLTFAWGDAGCELEFDGGAISIKPGDWMWIDSGFLHKGHNQPGSNFLTVFFPDDLVKQAGLCVAPIGAYAERAPYSMAHLLTCLAVDLLPCKSGGFFHQPAVDALLDWVRSEFPSMGLSEQHDRTSERAMKLIRSNPLDEQPISEIARRVELSQSELSRRFKKRFRVTPQSYRRQLRLVLATRYLAIGMGVTDVAFRCGFSDAAHLSRTFKSQYGVTPSHWSSTFRPL